MLATPTIYACMCPSCLIIIIITCIIVLVTIVTDRPEVKYLNRHVRDPLCAAGARGPDRWFDLGLALIGEGSRNSLDIMRIDQRNTYGCCDAMFSLWLERVPGANWSQLIQALRGISMDNIADDLTKRLKSKILAMYVYTSTSII